MPYWRLNEVQKMVLLDFVKGETVYDLGCGDLSLARLMATTAKQVEAVDKETPDWSDLPANLNFWANTFAEVAKKWPKHLDTVVTCWPQTTRMPGFTELVHRAFRVVYIGCNTDGSACGDHALWLNLTKRMLVHEVRDRPNCLHCYSLVTHQDPQFRSEEEVCGLLNQHGRFRVFGYGRLMVGELQEAKIVDDYSPDQRGTGCLCPRCLWQAEVQGEARHAVHVR